MLDKSKLSFSPIFNQSADSRTWALFTEIEMEAQIAKYNYNLNDSDRLRILKSHAQEWEWFRYNFAFAAYYDGQMVGFANGFLDDNSHMNLHNLYVLSQYNGLGIGKILLHQTERTAQLIVNNMKVESLAGATSFYERYGYTSSNQRTYKKKLSMKMVGTVPVFVWRGFMHFEYKVDFDRSLFIRNPKSPKFVYVGPDKKIMGAAIKTPDGENHFFVTNDHGKEMAEFYRNSLVRVLSCAR